jgi:hypothetical protein
VNPSDLGPLADCGDAGTIRAAEESRELMRIACQAAINRAAAGQQVDPLYLQSCLDFVRANPPLRRPLSDGVPSPLGAR